MRTASGNLDEQGQRAWLSAANTVSFSLDSGDILSQVGVAWIIENTQTNGTPMIVERYSGTRSIGGAEPDEWTETITDVANIESSSIMAETATSTGVQTAVPRGSIGFELNTTDEVTLWRSDTGQTQYYRFEVVEWPSATYPCVEFDVTPPNVTGITPSPGTWFNLNNTILITATVTDDTNVSYVMAIIEYPNGTQKNLTMTDDNKDDVYNVTFTGATITGRFNITVWANDTWNKISNNKTTYFYVNDTTAPAWSKNATFPPSGTTYSPTQAYQFNVSWTDNYKLDTVWIEHNFTGALKNYSITGNSSEVYYYNHGPLARGIYVWRMYANDTTSNLNKTDQWTYTVQNATSELNLTLNANSCNLTIEVFSGVNITAKLITPGSGYLELYQNSTLINSGNSPLTNITNYTQLKEYNITAIYPSTNNYTSTAQTFWVIVKDTQKPNVTSITPLEGTKYNTSNVVNITANVTDNYNLSSVKANITWLSYSELINLTDPDSDSIFKGNFTSTSNAGRYNVTILANDTSGNTNNTETTYFIVLAPPSLQTGKSSYIREETVTITGAGFNLNTNVTIDIYNSTGQSVSGYPKNVTSNDKGEISDSWPIPTDEPLGTYTINATDTSDPSRKGTATFDIVTAIIWADEYSYELGATANISGYNWDPDVNVTVNITDPDSQLVYGPKNLTSNSTGWVNDTWQIPYDSALGSYKISAIQPSNPEKNDDYTFEVKMRPVTIATQYTWYKINDSANITGTGFSPDSNITIDIYNSTGQSVAGYPKNVTSNASGAINGTWSIPDGQATGTYTVSATDYNYPNLENATTFVIVIQSIGTDKSAYSSGEPVYITGYYWDRESNVTMDIKNSTGGSASGYPKNVTAGANGYISDQWTAQPGSSLSIETYNLTAEQALQPGENAYTAFDVTRTATLTKDKIEYDQNEQVNITGSFYTPNSGVKILIKNLDNGNYMYLYPKIIQSDTSGNIQHYWSTSSWCEGNYSIESEDQTYPVQLFADKTFEITFLANTSSLKTAHSSNIALAAGPSYTSGGSYVNTTASDASIFYVGHADPNTETEIYIEMGFNISSLAIPYTSRINNLNIYLEYCYSGGKLACDGTDPPDEATYTTQDLEIYNFTGGSWDDWGNIQVGSDNSEHTGSWNITTGFSDYINSSNIARIRFESHALSYNDQYSDSYFIIDYSRLNISYKTPAEKSCTELLTSSLNLTSYNSSYKVNNNSTFSVINSSKDIIDTGQGTYFRYLLREDYDIKITTPLSVNSLTAIIRDVNLSVNESAIIQIVDNYTGSLPSQPVDPPAFRYSSLIKNTTSFFALNDTGLNYTHVELYIPKKSFNITSIMHCTSWNFTNANCTAWVVNETSDYSMQENTTHFWFNVTGFDSFGGGVKVPVANITNITIYNVTSLADTHTGGTLLPDNGLNKTHKINISSDDKFSETWRVEITVRNDGDANWNILAEDVAYHKGLNASWQINAVNDIWYIIGPQTKTGGTWSGGKVSWDTSLGGLLSKGSTMTFYYVFNITPDESGVYPVYFLVNDTSENAGSYDYSTYNVTALGQVNSSLNAPPDNTIVPKDRNFTINATVWCWYGDCGTVSGTARYNATTSAPDTSIPVSSGADLYIQGGPNPKSCGAMAKDSKCTLAWNVNATGALNKAYEVDVKFTSTYPTENDTSDSTITLGKILLMALGFTNIDFGAGDPGSTIPAQNNTDQLYNITLDPNSNDADVGLWVKGENLTGVGAY